MIRIYLCFLMAMMVPATKVAGAEDAGLRVVLLGTGTPNPTPDRQGPAIAILAGGKSYIIDAGAGIVRQAEAARQRHGIEALAAKNLEIAFLTHLHSDHTIGLADLLLTPWVLEREEPLKLYGPKGTKKLSDHLIKAYEDDIEIRIKGSQPQNTTGWQIESIEISPGFVFQDENISIEAIAACHGEISDAFGYLIRAGGKKIVISGDTTFCPAIQEAARGADILLHEAYSDEGFKALPDNWATYHQAYHTSASDLARLVNTARPKHLVLYHQLSWGGVKEEHILDEIKALTDIPVSYGRDLDLFEAATAQHE